MSKYSIHPPEISIKKLDEPSFEVEHREYHWFWFTNVELVQGGNVEIGQGVCMTAYQYPGPEFWERRERKIIRKAKIHDVECLELHGFEYDIDGNLIAESINYAKIDRGYLRTYAFQYVERDNTWLTTWKDNDFDANWNYDPGVPIKIVDVGKWRILDDEHFTDGGPISTPPDVNPNGAGVYEVRIGEAVHRCLRVLEPSNSAEGTMVEAFVNQHGRTMLARRYNGNRWSYGSARTIVDGKPKEWTELLPDAPRLYYNGICFVLWDFSIPDTAMLSGNVHYDR